MSMFIQQAAPDRSQPRKHAKHREQLKVICRPHTTRVMTSQQFQSTLTSERNVCGFDLSMKTISKLSAEVPICRLSQEAIA